MRRGLKIKKVRGEGRWKNNRSDEETDFNNNTSLKDICTKFNFNSNSNSNLISTLILLLIDFNYFFIYFIFSYPVS